MVIKVQGQTLSNPPVSTTQFFTDHPFIVNQSRELKKIPVREVGSNGCLYVSQAEYAVVPASDSHVKFVGSEDATTCHIVIFIHSNGGVAVAHFDGSASEGVALEKMVGKLQGNSNVDECVNVYAIGGFVGNPKVQGVKESLKLSVKLLKLFFSSKQVFNIMQWSCCDLNTIFSNDGSLRPYFYGLCYDRSQGSVFPATFKNYGPEPVIRSAYRWSSSASYGMANIYNSSDHSIKVHSFENRNHIQFQSYCQLCDNDLLSNFSTSPSTEPPDFASKIRNIFVLLADHPKPEETLFPGGKGRTYILDRNGNWKLKE